MAAFSSCAGHTQMISTEYTGIMSAEYTGMISLYTRMKATGHHWTTKKTFALWTDSTLESEFVD